MADDTRLERSLRTASEAVGLALGVALLWHYLDPTVEPKELLERAWAWTQERLSRVESFRRTLASIRNLPEREEP